MSTNKVPRALPYQPNPLRGWAWILAYWSICVAVGIRQGYFKELRMQYKAHSIATPWYLAITAAVLTIQAQICFSARCTNHGREQNLFAIAMFGFVNGVLETIAFVSVYDRSSHLAASSKSDPIQVMIIGFSSLLIFLGLIHALFWMPLVFPRHVREDAPPFHTHALPVLMVLTLAMMGPYIYFGDLLLPCFLHVYVDLSAAYAMRMR